MVEYTDRIYGKIQIDEDIILELINTEEFKRLKYIKQIGIPESMSNIVNFTRFEHSLGVYSLLKKFNCSLKELIVGLLHDVSHTCYSHTIDFVLGSSKIQDFQDNRHFGYIKHSSIGEILENYNYDIEEICDLLNYPNIKVKGVQLSADRLDYGLREISYIESLGVDYAKECFNNLDLITSGFIFKNKKSALKFANGFIEARDYYENFDMVVKFDLFSRWIKKAYEMEIINDFDFDLDDYRLLDKIIESKDKVLESIYNVLTSNEKFYEIVDSGEGRLVYTKYRNVNPAYLEDEKMKTLVETDNDYMNLIREKKEKYKKGVKYRVKNYIIKTLL